MVAAIAIGFVVPPLSAQEVRVEVATQEPPYYVGEPAVIQFNVEGLDEQPAPTCTIATESGQPVQGVRGQMAAANPSVFSQIIQRNGQLFRSQRVTYQIQYLVTADQPGEYLVGPFLIQQGSKSARAEAVPMSFRDVPIDPAMRVRLKLPEGPLYPDQRVPVGIEWWYADDFENVLKLSIYSPLFDQFRFGPDQQPARQSAQLPIETKDGRQILAATVRREEDDGGREFLVVSATRTMIPDRVGEFQLPPITATLRKATMWARSRSPLDRLDDFGFGGSLFRDLVEDRRRPARTALARAVGQPQQLVVKPFPSEGRPESFAGAVGNGFSIDVVADRTVVRVGDPIALTITLRGDGNIDNASLPALAADGGLDPSLFHLSQGDVPGTLTGGAKQFQVSVRVADDSVAEIPALAYSWFDPADETYRTARSKPIALRVMPAQVVSASDVVSRRPATNAASPSDGETELAVAPADNRIFSLSGADLAIEPDAGVVLRDSNMGTFVIAQTAIYVAGFLLVVVALIDRKRRAVDPAVIARRKTVRQQQARIARAASLDQRQAAEEVAAAVRVLIAEIPEIARDAAQEVVAECEAIAYAPETWARDRLDESLIERAKRVAEV